MPKTSKIQAIFIHSIQKQMGHLPYVGNISDITKDNQAFRKVLYTGAQLQIVAMCMKPGEDTGNDMHEKQDVLIRIEHGEAMVDVDGFEYTLNSNMAIVVPVGSKHRTKNISKDKLLYIHIVYALPYHPDYKIHYTKADADKEKVVPKKAVAAPKIATRPAAKTVNK